MKRFWPKMGRKPFEILENEKIHMIFMDIEMPVMNGIETTSISGMKCLPH